MAEPMARSVAGEVAGGKWELPWGLFSGTGVFAGHTGHFTERAGGFSGSAGRFGRSTIGSIAVTSGSLSPADDSVDLTNGLAWTTVRWVALTDSFLHPTVHHMG